MKILYKCDTCLLIHSSRKEGLACDNKGIIEAPLPIGTKILVKNRYPNTPSETWEERTIAGIQLDGHYWGYWLDKTIYVRKDRKINNAPLFIYEGSYRVLCVCERGYWRELDLLFPYEFGSIAEIKI